MKLQIANLGKVSLTVEENPWSINKAYDRLTIVEDNYLSYISRIPVPKGQPLANNRKYWVPFSTRNGAISVNSFTILTDESQLPTTAEENDGPYLIDGVAYFWVGTNGNAVDEKYQTINIQGPTGPQGPQGPQGEPGTDGSDGRDGITPHIGEDGNWWVGDTNTGYKAQGPAGTPGTNGRDGKDGTDGIDGANGANGKDGKDGNTPYIGDNGNWWINGKDTGKPSRGPQGEQGIPGEGNDGSYVYVTENPKRVVLVVKNALSAVLSSPPEGGISAKMSHIANYFDFMVNGYNITANVTVTANNNFRVRRVTDAEASTSLILTPEEINRGEGIIIRILPPVSINNSANATISVKSISEEFTNRYINVKYTMPLTPDIPGSQSGGGVTPSGPGVITGDQEYGQTNN